MIAEAAAQNPIAWPRISRGKVAAMMARLCGTSRAPPIPCTARAAIRIGAFGASAHPNEETAKMDDAGHEDAFAPDAIAKPASNEHQRAKRQRVGVHHPLHVGKACTELPLDDGQSDRHDGAVDEGHRRGEHRRCEHKPPRCFRHGKGKAIADRGRSEDPLELGFEAPRPPPPSRPERRGRSRLVTP